MAIGFLIPILDVLGASRLAASAVNVIKHGPFAAGGLVVAKEISDKSAKTHFQPNPSASHSISVETDHPQAAPSVVKALLQSTTKFSSIGAGPVGLVQELFNLASAQRFQELPDLLKGNRGSTSFPAVPPEIKSVGGYALLNPDATNASKNPGRTGFDANVTPLPPKIEMNGPSFWNQPLKSTSLDGSEESLSQEVQASSPVETNTPPQFATQPVSEFVKEVTTTKQQAELMLRDVEKMISEHPQGLEAVKTEYAERERLNQLRLPLKQWLEIKEKNLQDLEKTRAWLKEKFKL